MVLAWFGVLLGAVDLRWRRLPDVLTLPMYPVFAVLLSDQWVRAVCGCLVFGGAHLVVRLVRPAAMGGGDVKLAGALGAVLACDGWLSLVWAAGGAGLVSAGVGLVTRRRDVPHGPGLLAATWGLTVL
jgi:leader peptidase (prepilin peptidase) / N-methyltransferase